MGNWVHPNQPGNEVWVKDWRKEPRQQVGTGPHMVVLATPTAVKVTGIERVTGRKARGLQMEEIACKCQTFLSLLRGRRKQTSNIFFLLYTNLKGGFS